MKLNCNVDVVNRQLAGVNITSRGKSSQSILSIGKQSAKNNELFMLLQSKKNPTGTKYKVKNNIEGVFSKFVNDGKMTIRLREPSIDLNIKCTNIVELKSFLHILKMGIEEKLNASILGLSNLTTQKIPAPPKKKVTIKSKADYPVLEGFQRTTEQLFIIGLERKSFDRQILRLQSLKLLDLTDNLISSLPKELGTAFPHLKTLNLGKNSLGLARNTNAWSWLEGNCIQRNLQVLDLRENKLKYLPKQISKLTALVSLMLEKNELTELPASIGTMSSLNNLNLADNSLRTLPGSMIKLRLNTMNISGNFQIPPDNIPTSLTGIPTLTELGARIVVNCRFHFDSSIIPFTLVDYLDDAKFCVCGNSCFDVYTTKNVLMEPRTIAVNIITNGVDYLAFDCTFCSYKCIEKLVR